MKDDRISLSHGSGGRAMHELIKEVFLERFNNDILAGLNDSAVLDIGENGAKIAFTTDSFVVNPLVFPGGDIGKLAVCGTLNDLAVSGARPVFLSASFIVEEGMEISLLETIADSMADVCRASGVKVVAGDFKVAEKGAADGIFINTSGIGLMPEGLGFSMRAIRPSDKIIINGSIGDHEIAVLVERGDFNFSSPVKSDCCSLYPLIREICALHLRILASRGEEAVRFMRDPTRGGVAATVNEISRDAGVGIEIFEQELPVGDNVASACEMLGLDPLYLANEGKVIIVVNEKYAGECLTVMRNHPLGRDAKIIGSATETPAGRVILETGIGGKRIIGMPEGGQLPRIC